MHSFPFLSVCQFVFLNLSLLSVSVVASNLSPPPHPSLPLPSLAVTGQPPRLPACWEFGSGGGRQAGAGVTARIHGDGSL